MRFHTKEASVCLLVTVPIIGLLFFTAVNPPSVQAVPSYARQTGLPCSGCHYAPPELNLPVEDSNCSATSIGETTQNRKGRWRQKARRA